MGVREFLKPRGDVVFRPISFRGIRRPRFFATGEKLPYPVETSALALLQTFLHLLVGKVGGDSVERFAMHRLGAQLHFQGASVTRIYGCVDALVAVGFRKCNVIFYLARRRPPMGVDYAERRITIGNV